MEDLEHVILQYIKDEFAHLPDLGEVAFDTPIVESGLIDSLMIFQLIAFIEDQFGVAISPDQISFENFETISAISNLVKDIQDDTA